MKLLLSIPLYILKVIEASSKPKFVSKKNKWFFRYVIPQMFENEEPTIVTLHLWEFVFYNQFAKFDSWITEGIYDWNEERVNGNGVPR